MVESAIIPGGFTGNRYFTKPVIDGGTLKTRVFKNFIDGESGSSPRVERLLKIAIPLIRARWWQFFSGRIKLTWSRGGCGQACLCEMAAGSGAPAGRDGISRGRDFDGAEGEYARDMTREMGKVLKETRGDVQEAIDAAYYNAGEGRRLFGPTVPSELPNKFAMAVRQPIGVCGMITPWNFPMAISSWKLLPAIVCGNACVIKPAQDTTSVDFQFGFGAYDAGVPKGVINIVSGYGPEAGTPLLEHAAVRAISFTGSTAVGRIIGTTAAKSFKHCSLELGGKNPMIVLDDANLELAVEGGLWGAFGTTGQRCTATSRIIVQKGVYRQFVEQFVARAKKIKVGNGLDETVEMGPAVNENQLNTDLKYIEIGRNECAKLVLGGNRLDKGEYQHGWFIEPTVFTDVDPKMRIAQEEIFGPVVSIIPCEDLENAIEIANGIEYGLSSSLYTKDVNKAFAAIRDWRQASRISTRRRLARKCICRLGGPRLPGMGIAKAGSGQLISIRNGSRYTWITLTRYRRPRLIGESSGAVSQFSVLSS